MIFNFAIDEVKLCLVRQNFTIEADTVEEAQMGAIDHFTKDVFAPSVVDMGIEVFLDVESRTDGYKELIYRAENGGQVLKDNAPPKVEKPEIEIYEYLTGPQGMKFELYPIRGIHTMDDVKALDQQLYRDRDVAGIKVIWKKSAKGQD